MNKQPKRIQRKRVKGWKLPENTVCVTRPGKYGNPFAVGGWYKKGDHAPGNKAFRFTFTERLINQPEDIQDAINTGYTQIKTSAEAVEWFRWYVEVTGKTFVSLRGWNLACWCKEGDCCHGDVILEIANKGTSK